MILDTSALTAIFFGEPEAARFAQLIRDSDRCRISVPNFVELCMVIEGQMGPMRVGRLTYFPAER